jgi:hypothetical protein
LFTNWKATFNMRMNLFVSLVFFSVIISHGNILQSALWYGCHVLQYIAIRFCRIVTSLILTDKSWSASRHTSSMI